MLKKILTHDKLLFVLIVISLFPLMPLLSPGLPLTHDGQDHVARISNFYTSLSEGNIIPRWAANLNWGYGHPVLMFLYPLPSYMASLFLFLHFGLVGSVKLVFAAGFVLSMVFAYLWGREQFDRKSAFILAALYGFAPYRFIDLYVRGAIGEHTAFIWPPLILYFVYGMWLRSTRKANKIGEYRKLLLNIFGGAVALALLIMSHNAISIMFIPLIISYIILLCYKLPNNRLLFLIHNSISISLGFALSAFYWIPAFFEGKYTLRDIVTRGEFSDRFVPLWDFIFSGWNYGGGTEFSKSLGFWQWIGVIMLLILVLTNRKFRRLSYLLLLFAFVSTLFLMTRFSGEIYNSLTLLQKFQFPWRFLTLMTFISAVISSISLKILFTQFSRLFRIDPVWIYAFFLFTLFVSTLKMWKPQGYLIRPETFFTSPYPGTTDTGESSPIWSVRFMEHYPTAPIEITKGGAKIKAINRNTTSRYYHVDVPQSVRLAENTLYFPGWNVYIDGVKTGIQYQDPGYRGLITFWVTSGMHDIKIIFERTRMRQMADIISLTSGILVIIVLIFSGLWPKIHKVKII